MKRFSIFFLVFSISFGALSQIEIPARPDISLFDFTNNPPDNLLSSRSIVFVDFPDTRKNVTIRGDWKAFAQKFHQEFKRIGIDAVAYYHLSDFYAGIDATAGFVKLAQNRKIENLIFLRQSQTPLGVEIEIIITSNEAVEGLLLPNQKAYRLSGTELSSLGLRLGRDIYQAKLPNRNFLIPDEPEFFTDTDVVKGRRYESFTSDLRIGKLAVPLFAKYSFPAGLDSSKVTADKFEIIREHDRRIDHLNETLKGIMVNYPFEYELVDYSLGEVHLYRVEFSHVLMLLHSTGRNIRELLNYEIDYSETDYITLKSITKEHKTLEQIPVAAPVFKFYTKHLVNKEIYLGTEWDADLSWEGALRNHLNNFKRALEDGNN